MQRSYLEIALIEEKRQAEGVGAIARCSERIAGGVMSYNAPGSWANQACGLGLEGAVCDADLGRLVDFYTSRGVEPRIDVCPFAHETLVRGLAARGFRLHQFENVLAREIDARAAAPIVASVGGARVEIRPIDPGDEGALRAYTEIVWRGFIPPGAPLPGDAFETSAAAARLPDHELFLAFAGGTPVGACAMQHGERCAALFGASVPEAYRKRGVQGAMIAHRLERARARGLSLAVIHSKPGIPTERNAARLGFFMAYSKAVLTMPGPGLVPSP